MHAAVLPCCCSIARPPPLDDALLLLDTSALLDLVPYTVTLVRCDPDVTRIVDVVYQNPASLHVYGPLVPDAPIAARFLEAVQNSSVHGGCGSLHEFVRPTTTAERSDDSTASLSHRSLLYIIDVNYVPDGAGRLFVVTQGDGLPLALLRQRHRLLSTLLPQHLIQTTSTSDDADAALATVHEHDAVTIAFMYVDGFDDAVDQHQRAPDILLHFLGSLFDGFDALIDDLGLDALCKLETSGSCYVVAAGILKRAGSSRLVPAPSHDPFASAQEAVRFVRAAAAFASQLHLPLLNDDVHESDDDVHEVLRHCRLRVGLCTGAVVSGCIGTQLPKLALFGDAMNVASRMGSTAPAGRIQVAASTAALLVGVEPLEARGPVHIKGKGAMHTFLLL